MFDFKEFLKLNREEKIGVKFSALSDYESSASEPMWDVLVNVISLFDYRAVFTDGKERIVNPDFGDFLKEQRNKRGISQAEFSEMIDTDSSQISRYETHNKIPSWYVLNRTLQKLGYELEVEPND